MHPKVAYYSTKLQTERLETLRFAKELRKEINRPLAVCDPFVESVPHYLP